MALILKYCWLSAIVDIVIAYQRPDQSGREFVVMLPVIPDSLQNASITRVYVNAPSYTLITVLQPGMTAITQISSGSSATEITLSESVQYHEQAEIAFKGVLIQTDQDATVNVIRGELEGYLAIPKTVWSMEYVIVSYNPVGGYSYFTIAAFENDTEVDIVFKESFSGNCLALFGGSKSTKIVLQRQQVWGVYCDNGDDLTGVHVRSSRPVNVIAGATMDGVVEDEFMEEMLIPNAFHGRKFLLPTVNALGSVWRIVASGNDTLVYGNGEAESYLDLGDYFEINSDTSGIACLKSTRPIQVMLVGKSSGPSQYSADNFLGQPVMVTVPPIERFKQSYEIEIFKPNTLFSLSSYVVFLFETKYETEMPEDLEWPDSSITEHDSCCGYSTFHLTDSTYSKFTVSRNFSFGVIQLGLNHGKQRGFGVLAGMSFDDPYCPIHSAYKSISGSLCVETLTSAVDWVAATDTCEGHRARLVKLDTYKKMFSIKQQLGPLLENQSFWIGLERTQTGYRWSDGETLSFEDWTMLQPDNSGDCVRLSSTGSQPGWDDAACSTLAGYVCEKVLTKQEDINIFNAECTDSPPFCPVARGYFYFSAGDYCVKPNFTAMSWSSANNECRSDGGRLATVDSKNKLNHLYYLVREIWEDFFIGGSWHNLTGNQWAWTDCSPVLYSNWAVDQPIATDKNCVAMDSEDTWHSVDCSLPKKFVCEIQSNATHNNVTEADDGACAPVISTSEIRSSTASFSTTHASSTSSSSRPSLIEATPTVEPSSSTTAAANNSQPSSYLSASQYPDNSQSSQPLSSSIVSSPTTGMGNSSSTLYVGDGIPTTSSSSLQPNPDQTLETSSSSITVTPEATQPSSPSDSPGTGGYSTTEPLQTTTTSTVPQPDPNPDTDRTVSEACYCHCIPQDRPEDPRSDAVQRKQEQIRKELLLNKRNLTSYIYKYVSMEDNRESAKSLGGLGLALIVAPMVVLVLSDLMSLLTRQGNGFQPRV